MLGACEQFQKFFQTHNLKRYWAAGLFQPDANRTSRIKQHEVNVVILSPSLQEHQHAEATALNRIHF